MKILITLILCIGYIVGDAQIDSTQLLKDKRQYKNEICFNIRNIGNGPIFNNISLMYKRNYRRGKLISVNSITKMRFFIGSLRSQVELTHDPTQDSLQFTLEDLGVNGNRSSVVNNAADINYYKAYDNIDISLGFGLERSNFVNNLVFSYGLDVIVGYAMVEDNRGELSFDGILFNHTSTTDIRLRSYQLGFNPFAGLKYYLNKRLSIGFETGLYLGYFESAVLYYGGGPTVPSRGIRTSYNSIRRIDISYIF